MFELHSAVAEGNIRRIKELLKNRQCDINKKDENNCTVLHVAVAEQQYTALQLLLEDTRCNSSILDARKLSVLQGAIDKGDTTAVKILLQFQSLDINLKGCDGYTALHFAASRGHVETLRLLLQRADCGVNMRDSWDRSALDLAIVNGNKEAMTLILHDKRCVLNGSGGVSKYAVLSAAKYPRPRAKEILKENIRLSKLIPYLKSTNKEDDLLSVFISKCGDLSKFREYEYYTECHDLLLSCLGPSKCSDSTLPNAVLYAPFSLCEKLLNKGISSNTCFPDGETSLHCAIRMNSVSKCRLLLSHGARHDVKYQNMTPFEYAVSTACKSDIFNLFSGCYDEDVITDILSKVCFNKESLDSCAKRLGISLFSKLEEATNNCSKSDTQNPTYSELCSSQLPVKREAKEKVDDSMIQNIIATAHWCNYEIEKREMVQDVKSLFKRISDNFEQRKETEHFAFNTTLAGSTSEGTKIFWADELDLICVFKSTKGLIFDTPVIIGSDESPWTNCWQVPVPKGTQRSSKPYIFPHQVAKDFYSALNNELNKLFLENKSFGRIHLHFKTFEQKERISCLQLLWKGDIFKDTVVSVDVVPAFPLSFEGVSPWLVPDPLPLGFVSTTYHLMPKQPRRVLGDKVDHDFDISHAVAENEFIRYVPFHLRHAYIVAKALRIGTICESEETMSLLCGEPIKAEDIITSYMLKTCLFHVLNITENQTFEDRIECLTESDAPRTVHGNAYDWADRIYEELEQSMIRRVLPCQYSTFELQFYCADYQTGPTHSDSDVPKYCCMKRNLILSLCKSIRTWLRDNKAALEQRTYGLHLVYSRNNYKGVI